LFLPIDPVNPFLVLHVSRTNLVQDTIDQLTKQAVMDLKKPLKVDVVFLGYAHLQLNLIISNSDNSNFRLIELGETLLTYT